MDVPRAHTPTWTPPSDWAAGPARELEEQEIDVLPTMPLASRLRKPGHRRAQTQTLEKVLQTPPTTNVMLAADKTHLRKTSRKLERMLGEMPVIMLEDGDDDEVILNVGDNGASGVRRRTTVTGHGDASRAVGRKHLPWQNQTDDTPPSRAASPFPQLRIDSAALISTASPHSAQPTPSDDVHSNRLSVTSSDGNVSSNGITPPASPGFLPEQDDKRRAQNQMQKLQRFLGESVPAELLLQPVQSNLSTQSSAASPTSPASTDNGLKAKARRRLSLELSTLAAFSLTSRLTGGGKDSGRTTPSGGRDSPAPRAASPRQDSPSPSFAFAHSSGRRHLPASLSISSSSIYSELDPPMESPTEHAHIVEAENVIFMSPTASDVLSPMSIDIRSPLTPGTINLASPLPLERSPGLKRSPSSIERKLAAVTPAPSYESSSLRLPKRGQSQDLLSTHLQSHEHALPLPHTLHKAMVEHEARTKRRDKELKDREKAERKERERLEKEFEKEMKTREKELKLEQKRTRDRSRTIGSSGSGSRSQTASMFEPMPTTSRPATASSTKSAAPPLISKKPSKAQLVSVSSAISADKQPTASAPSTVSKASATSSTNSRAELATLATKLSLDVPSSKLSLDMGRSSTASSSDSGHGHNSRLPTSPTSPPSGGLRGLLRKKSFDAWGGRGGGMSGLPPLPLLKSQISSPLPAIPPSPVGRRRDESPAAGRNASPLRNENSPGTRRNDSPSRTPSLQRQESVSATSSSTRRRDASPSVSRQDSAPARIEHGSSTLSLNRTESRGSPRLRTAELISSPNGSSTRLLRSPDSPSIKASRSLLQDVPVPPLPTNHASSPLRKATNLPTPPVPPLPQSVEGVPRLSVEQYSGSGRSSYDTPRLSRRSEDGPSPVRRSDDRRSGEDLDSSRSVGSTTAAAQDNRYASDDIRLPERKLGRSRSFHHDREDLNVKTPSKDDSSVLNDDSLRVPTPTLRRSSSQRSTRSRSDDEERSRSRRRKSRSMTGLASLAGLDDVAASVPIGKLSLGGQTLDLDEDPVWDADPRQRSRGGEPVGMIRADVVDEANVDWMFARPDNRAPTGLARAHSNSRRRRAKAVEDIDPETDSVFDKDLSRDGSSPSFIDPFSTGQDSARNVHSSEGSTTVIGRDRSRSSPIIPQRSSRRPAINTPNAPSPVIQPLSPNAVTPTSLTIRSTVTALAQQEKEKERSKFSRLFGGSSKGNTVLRKSDRDRDRSLERKFNTPIVQDPAPPLPTVHHDSQAHVEVVDSDGRTVQANADPMYMLRQLRAI